MDSIAVIAIVVAIVALAVGYIVKAKKRGVKCVGCPSGGSCSCSGGCSCGGSCSCGSETKEL